MNKIKLIVIGHGRSGKDTFCRMLTEEFRVSFKSSSKFIAEKLFPIINQRVGQEGYPKQEYKTVKECYKDRHNFRPLWFDLISEYNSQDPTRLTREILLEHDIYCGLRNKDELDKNNPLALTLWIDATGRSEYNEPESSMTVTEMDSDLTVYNQTSLKELRSQAVLLGTVITKYKRRFLIERLALRLFNFIKRKLYGED